MSEADEKLDFAFDDTVKMKLDRVAGTRNDELSVYASSLDAAAKGLCQLLKLTAAQFGRSDEEILCRMAVLLFKQGEDGHGSKTE